VAPAKSLTRFGEPDRVAEVVERDNRLQPVRPRRLQYPSIVLDGDLADLAGAGFDSAPLDRESMRVLTKPTEQRKVLIEAVEMVAGQP
jgi:hypothetical protein